MRIPGVPYVQGRNSYSDADGKHYGIAIHNTSNDASDEGEASYATRRTDGVSSHLYCDKDSVTQSLSLTARAGHAGSAEGNNHSIAVEITGSNGKSRAWWLANVAWDKLGRALAWVIQNDPDYRGFQVRRASVAEMKANPRVKAFYGHNDMRLAWGGTTHTDPGQNFPWDKLFSSVNAALAGEDDDVSAEDVIKATETDRPWRSDGVARLAKAKGLSTKDSRVLLEMAWEQAALSRDLLLEVRANQATMLGRDWVDEQQIVDGVLHGLGSKNLDEAAAALRAVFGDRAAELGAKLTQSG